MSLPVPLPPGPNVHSLGSLFFVIAAITIISGSRSNRILVMYPHWRILSSFNKVQLDGHQRRSRRCEHPNRCDQALFRYHPPNPSRNLVSMTLPSLNLRGGTCCRRLGERDDGGRSHCGKSRGDDPSCCEHGDRGDCYRGSTHDHAMISGSIVSQ